MTPVEEVMAQTIKPRQMTKKRRFGYTLLFMAIFAGLYQAGTFVQVDLETATELMAEFEKIVENIDGIGIFFHNATLALMMFIPGFGAVWGGIAGFQTGYAFSAAVTIQPVLGQFPALLLFVTPFGLMELFAYGIAMSRSVFLLKDAIKLRTVFIKPLVIEVGIVIALLLSGGLLEMAMIDWASEMGYDLTEMLT